MAYNKFSLARLQKELNVSVLQRVWLPQHLPDFATDEWLDSLFANLNGVFLGTEKARFGYVIAPILHVLRRYNAQRFSIFSGYEFNIDKTAALNGFCDFILSAQMESLLIEAPAFFVVETKKNDIDDRAIAQCSAEMYAA